MMFNSLVLFSIVKLYLQKRKQNNETVNLQFEELPYEDRSFKEFYEKIRASTLDEAIKTGRAAGHERYKSAKDIISFLASQIANKRHPCVYILDDNNNQVPYEQMEAEIEADENSNRNDETI